MSKRMKSSLVPVVIAISALFVVAIDARLGLLYTLVAGTVVFILYRRQLACKSSVRIAAFIPIAAAVSWFVVRYILKVQ